MQLGSPRRQMGELLQGRCLLSAFCKMWGPGPAGSGGSGSHQVGDWGLHPSSSPRSAWPRPWGFLWSTRRMGISKHEKTVHLTTARPTKVGERSRPPFAVAHLAGRLGHGPPDFVPPRPAPQPPCIPPSTPSPVNGSASRGPALLSHPRSAIRVDRAKRDKFLLIRPPDSSHLLIISMIVSIRLGN